MLAVLAPIIIFGVVIFIHELGHFIAAKLTGVYAPRFSVGFGPALLRMRRGETEYVLAAFPLGGYVRMASRHDAETAFIEGGEETDGLKEGDAGFDPEAMMPFGPKPVPEHRWFESKPLPARLFIMIAGVTMNVILAYVIITGFILSLGRETVPTRVVGTVAAPLSQSSLVQLQPGDTISAVNGRAVHSWNDIVEAILAAPPGTLALRTQRGELGIPVGTGNDPKPMDIVKAIDFHRPPVIGELVGGAAGQKAGLQVGDSIAAIDGQPVRDWQGMVKIVSTSPGKTLTFDVWRNGVARPVVVRPAPTAERDPETKAPRVVGKIGARESDISVREPVGVGEALAGGARETWGATTEIFGVVKGLVTAKVSPRELGGPIAITRASVEAGQGGLKKIIMLIASLSLNVAVLNLLPIPILDGGQVLVNVIESAKGSPLSARTREYVLRVGLVAILMIFLMSTYNDVLRLFKDYVAPLFS